MIILIDNYDSFTWNLWHFLSDLGAEVITIRNDAKSVEEILAMQPSGLVLSPGQKQGASHSFAFLFGQQRKIGLAAGRTVKGDMCSHRKQDTKRPVCFYPVDIFHARFFRPNKIYRLAKLERDFTQYLMTGCTIYTQRAQP